MQLNWLRATAAVMRRKATVGEPWCAYVYDLEALQRHVRRLVNSLPPNCELFYAVKANSEAPILETLVPEVAGFEVASGGELAWVRNRFPRIPIVFGGPGKTDGELKDALEAGVEYIHVESLGELERLAAIVRQRRTQQSILLRINLPLPELATTSLTMGGRPTPFGIDAAQLPDCLAWLQNHPELRLEGFHFHLLSHQLDARAHLSLLEAYFRTVRDWCFHYRLAINHINVGGGIGINYREPDCQFDWAAFSAGLAALVDRWGMADHRIRFELGRYLTAACGYYVMEVLDIKQTFGRTFAVARGGTHHFRTPYAQGHSHPFRVLPLEGWSRSYPRAEAAGVPVTVVGQLCTPKDVLATDTVVERVRVGDLLLFSYAGAYAWHISHHDFLRHPYPDQLYLPAEESEASHAANE